MELAPVYKTPQLHCKKRKVMVEPWLAGSLALAPVEEDEISPETAAVLDRARASMANGEGIPHEEIVREFGVIK
jgi:hypothetical protein